MKKNLVLSVLALFVMLHVAGIQSLSAQSGATLSVQGVIKNSDGSAVEDGSYSIKFSLYASESGGTPVWTETQDAVDVTGGIYSVLLGASSPLTAAFDQTYYMGMSIDGGAELIPRARLTSSPYALSLVGTGNLFPSSGAIGAGTVSPAAGYQLHVKNDNGDGKMLVEGSGSSGIYFKKGSETGSIGLIGNENKLGFYYGNDLKAAVGSNGFEVAGGFSLSDLTVESANSGTIVLSRLNAASFSEGVHANTDYWALKSGGTNGTERIRVRSNGLTEMTGGLRVDGFYDHGNSNHWYYGAGVPASGFSTGSGTIGANIWGDAIHALVFRAYSDQRIKQNARQSDAAVDLATLRNLRVTDYQYVDVIAKGNGWHKGFIAQEVENVFPEAVAKSEDHIPNIYCLTESVQEAGSNQLAVSLAKAHGLAVGDEVKIIMDGGDGNRYEKVTGVTGDNSAVITWSGNKPDRLFIYGKKVNDFRQVDYTQVHTMAVSAIQELARQLDALKAENALLKSDNAALKSANHQLEASVDKIDARLRSLENKLSN